MIYMYYKKTHLNFQYLNKSNNDLLDTAIYSRIHHIPLFMQKDDNIDEENKTTRILDWNCSFNSSSVDYMNYIENNMSTSIRDTHNFWLCFWWLWSNYELLSLYGNVVHINQMEATVLMQRILYYHKQAGVILRLLNFWSSFLLYDK